MARKVRKYSDTQIYHVMLRGINKQDIFVEQQDYYKFLKDLKLVKERYGLKIYAYCLMPNHVHLLFKDQNDSISAAMHSLGIRYSSYMNRKYDRVGHLFQNRYLSKTVEDRQYLIYLQRYIHQNPLKAGIGTLEAYKWSSYLEYVYQAKIVDCLPILKLFGKNRGEALKTFKQYHQEMKMLDKSIEEDFEFISRTSMTDEELIKKIYEKIQIKNIYILQQYRKDIRDTYIKKILEIRGTNIKQIARVLGISTRTIHRIKNNKKKEEEMCP